MFQQTLWQIKLGLRQMNKKWFCYLLILSQYLHSCELQQTGIIAMVIMCVMGWTDRDREKRCSQMGRWGANLGRSTDGRWVMWLGWGVAARNLDWAQDELGDSTLPWHKKAFISDYLQKPTVKWYMSVIWGPHRPSIENGTYPNRMCPKLGLMEFIREAMKFENSLIAARFM